MIKKFESFSGKKIAYYHGLGGSPKNETRLVINSLGSNNTIHYPHIDYYEEWDLDECKSLMEREIEACQDCDIIMGMSLGGYTAFLLGNILKKDTVLINPSINRAKTLLDIKSFDVQFNHDVPNLEIFFGELDNVVPKENTLEYLKQHKIPYKGYLIREMEHSCTLQEFKLMLKTSKLFNN